MKINLKKEDKYVELNDGNLAVIAGAVESIIDNHAEICGKDKILTIPACFDTETTKAKTPDNKTFSVIWCTQLQFGKLTIIARKYKLMLELFKIIASKISLTNCSLMIGIANMKYEMGFLFKEIMNLSEGKKLKFGSLVPHSRSPLTVSLGGVKFVDICKIANASLATIGRNYTKTQKMVGDLDYSVIRNSLTPVKWKELRYCINDVKVGSEYMEYLYETFTRKGKKFPLTSTAVPRTMMKERTRHKEGRKTVCDPAVPHARYSFPNTYREYVYEMDYLFRGGFVHGNAYYINEIVENIGCFDYTSDYPAIMLQELFPTLFYDCLYLDEETGEKVSVDVFKHEPGLNCLRDNMDKFAFKSIVTFYNINATTTHTIESVNKVIPQLGRPLKDGVNCIIDNGRIKSADSITVFITELDYDIYTKFYSWNKLEVHDLKVSVKAPLPEYVTSVVKEQYIAKADLKKARKDETPEYVMCKGILNSCYGVMVQRLNMEQYIPFITADENFEYRLVKFNRDLFTPPEIKPDDAKAEQKLRKWEQFKNEVRSKIFMTLGLDWSVPANIEIVDCTVRALRDGVKIKAEYKPFADAVQECLTEITYKSELKKQFLSPYWGIWVTAYARHRILSMIYDIEQRAKANNWEPGVVYSDTDSIYLRDYNKYQDLIDKWNAHVINDLNKDLEDGYNDLGCFDFNPNKDHCEKFKTLGAKRYIKTYKTTKTKHDVVLEGDCVTLKTWKETVEVTKATISGLRKDAFNSAYKKANADPYDFFNDAMYVDEFTADKLTSVYTDSPYSIDVTDEYGNTETMTQEQGVELREISFEMKISACFAWKLERAQRTL